MVHVFVSGPYSAETNEGRLKNTENAIAAGEELANLGFVPFVPHLNHWWDSYFPHYPGFWYAYDLEWLERCDCLLRLDGDSVGADREVEYAIKLNKPVYYCIEVLRRENDRPKQEE